MIHELAAILRNAEASRDPISPFAKAFGLVDIETAYAVQYANIENRLKYEHTLAGRKVGLTSTAVQMQLGVTEPVHGPVYSDRKISNGEIARLDWFIAPRVEAEIAFIFDRDVLEAEEIRDAVQFVLPALEIADSRVLDWQTSLFEAVADSSMASRYLLGAKGISIDDIDLSACQMTLLKNGQLASSGSGAECLGNPLNAAKWLALKMIQEGSPLKAGDIVLTGGPYGRGPTR